MSIGRRTVTWAACSLSALAFVPLGARAQPMSGIDCTVAQSIPPAQSFERPVTTLTPQRSELSLDPDERRKVTYRVSRTGAPTALDVYFLIDTTGSMTSSICSLQRHVIDIAARLRQANIDVHFGIAEFRDYPKGNSGIGDYPYRRLRKVGPVDEALVRKVGRLDASGGGDGPESALAALYQSATGAGQTFRHGKHQGTIPAGHDAEFRPDSLRVIVNITDAEFHLPGPKYPGPDWPTVTRALRRERILQVGIAARSAAVRHLKRAARKTGARAPASGVDCDGDGSTTGRTDVRPGEPLVCDISTLGLGVTSANPSSGMPDAIVNTLAAIADRTRIRLQARGDRRPVETISPRAGISMDLTESGSGQFTVTYACSGTPGRHTVELAVRLRDLVPARALTVVTCRSRFGGPAVFASGAAASVGPHAPAQQLAPQPQPQPQPNPGAQPNGAIVPATQEEPQTALVRAFDDAAGTQYEAGSIRRGPDPRTTLAAGLAVAIACGVALSTRATVARVSPARARDRRKAVG